MLPAFDGNIIAAALPLHTSTAVAGATVQDAQQFSATHARGQGSPLTQLLTAGVLISADEVLPTSSDGTLRLFFLVCPSKPTELS